MKILNKQRVICLLVTFCILSMVPAAYAQNINGEIINVNVSQNVAFIDLGKDSINMGDVFLVNTLNGDMYLDVVEVTAAVSKLTLSKNSIYKSKSVDLQSLNIGSQAKRVLTQNQSNVEAVAEPAKTLDLPEGMPHIDPQVLVKPNIANETIQGIDKHLDRMVESNVKLFNALTELLNEKKQWQNDVDKMHAAFLVSQDQNQTLIKEQATLKEALVQLEQQKSVLVSDNENNIKLLDQANAKLLVLKKSLDGLNKIIQDRLKQ